MALITRQGHAQVAAVLNAMKAAKPDDVSAIIAQIDQLSINHRRHLFATIEHNSMLRLPLREPADHFVAYTLEQHASEFFLPLHVDIVLYYIRNYGNRRFITSLLWLAARDKKVSVVALLLAHGADINEKFAGYTPLTICLYRSVKSADTIHIAEMLIEHGASLTYTDGKRVCNRGVITPLMLAAGNHPQLVHVILERLRAAGHDVSTHVQACDWMGRTALHYAAGGSRNARLRHADVNVVASLCKHGADLYARDHEGRDAFMSSCYWLNVRQRGIHWTARHVWSRINYLIGVFQPSLVKQWQAWELVGAQASLDLYVLGYNQLNVDKDELEVENHNGEPEAPNDADNITFYEQALTIRQLLSPEDIPPIPVIPLFAIYVEPVTVEALHELRGDVSLMLQHAVQVKRRHLGDKSLAVSAALDKYAEYLGNTGTVQRAFECRMLALRSRPLMRELLRTKVADEQHLDAYPEHFVNHLHFASAYLDEVYNRRRWLRKTPIEDTVWDDAMVVMQATVDAITLTDTIDNTYRYKQVALKSVLILITRCLGPLNDRRTAELQHVVNGLVIDGCNKNIWSGQHTIVFKLFNEIINAIVRYVDDGESDSEDDEADNDRWERSYRCLTPDGIVFIARAASQAGVSLNPPREIESEASRVQLLDPPRNSGPTALKAPLFVCAQLLAKPRQRITEKSKDDLRRVMELLVDEGGAHWDAADNTHNTAVRHFDSVTVSRYMNLQCLAARVVSAHVTDYDLYLPPSLVNFVKLH
jgi:ankyrin repeat protein